MIVVIPTTNGIDLFWNLKKMAKPRRVHAKFIESATPDNRADDMLVLDSHGKLK
jgi:hypothetical protein